MGKKEWDDIIIVSTDKISGKKIIKTLGLVEASTSLTKKKGQSKLRKKTFKIGGNAVVSVQTNQTRTAEGARIISYSGTAVIVEDE